MTGRSKPPAGARGFADWLRRVSDATLDELVSEADACAKVLRGADDTRDFGRFATTVIAFEAARRGN